MVLEEINNTLEVLVPQNFTLREVAFYALQGPAKRLRPQLVIAASEMLGVSKEHAMHPACALEFLHTYSLIHDDLPCMDDDDYRRGRPTVHRQYDEASAVLVGDFFLTHSFQILAAAPYLTDAQKISLVRTLAHHGGALGLIEGQSLDLAGSEDMTTLHALKTAALFLAAMEFSEILAGRKEPQLLAFGYHFGLLFQALDDLQDNDFPAGQEKTEASVLKHQTICDKLLAQLPYDHSKLSSLYQRILTP